MRAPVVALSAALLLCAAAVVVSGSGARDDGAPSQQPPPPPPQPPPPPPASRSGPPPPPQPQQLRCSRRVRGGTECLGLATSAEVQETRQRVRRKLEDRGLRVEVLYFAGRWVFHEFMGWALRANLWEFGGVVSSVAWHFRSAGKAQQAAHLRRVRRFRPPGSAFVLRHMRTFWWGEPYMAAVNQTSTVFIKMDDDVVYLHPGALERLVEAWLDDSVRSRCAVLSANVANHMGLHPLHADRNALKVPAAEVRYDGVGGRISGSHVRPREWWAAHASLINAVASCDTSNHTGFGVYDLNAAFSGWPRWSINLFVFGGLAHDDLFAKKPFGRGLASMPGPYRDSAGMPDTAVDELYFSMHYPRVLRKASCFLGDALAAHMMFTAQHREYRRVTGARGSSKTNDWAKVVPDVAPLHRVYRRLAVMLYGDADGPRRECCGQEAGCAEMIQGVPTSRDFG